MDDSGGSWRRVGNKDYLKAGLEQDLHYEQGLKYAEAGYQGKENGYRDRFRIWGG